MHSIRVDLRDPLDRTRTLCASNQYTAGTLRYILHTRGTLAG